MSDTFLNITANPLVSGKRQLDYTDDKLEQIEKTVRKRIKPDSIVGEIQSISDTKRRSTLLHSLLCKIKFSPGIVFNLLKDIVYYQNRSDTEITDKSYIDKVTLLSLVQEQRNSREGANINGNFSVISTLKVFIYLGVNGYKAFERMDRNSNDLLLDKTKVEAFFTTTFPKPFPVLPGDNGIPDVRLLTKHTNHQQFSFGPLNNPHFKVACFLPPFGLLNNDRIETAFFGPKHENRPEGYGWRNLPLRLNDGKSIVIWLGGNWHKGKLQENSMQVFISHAADNRACRVDYPVTKKDLSDFNKTLMGNQVDRPAVVAKTERSLFTLSAEELEEQALESLFQAISHRLKSSRLIYQHNAEIDLAPVSNGQITEPDLAPNAMSDDANKTAEIIRQFADIYTRGVKDPLAVADHLKIGLEQANFLVKYAEKAAAASLLNNYSLSTQSATHARLPGTYSPLIKQTFLELIRDSYGVERAASLLCVDMETANRWLLTGQPVNTTNSMNGTDNRLTIASRHTQPTTLPADALTTTYPEVYRGLPPESVSIPRLDPIPNSFNTLSVIQAQHKAMPSHIQVNTLSPYLTPQPTPSPLLATTQQPDARPEEEEEYMDYRAFFDEQFTAISGRAYRDEQPVVTRKTYRLEATSPKIQQFKEGLFNFHDPLSFDAMKEEPIKKEDTVNYSNTMSGNPFDFLNFDNI